MNVIRKLSRQQYQQFVENYYHGHYGQITMSTAFIKFYTQLDDPLLFSLEDEADLLDHIEANYVELEQLDT
jgi:hypothetical protein